TRPARRISAPRFCPRSARRLKTTARRRHETLLPRTIVETGWAASAPPRTHHSQAPPPEWLLSGYRAQIRQRGSAWSGHLRWQWHGQGSLKITHCNQENYKKPQKYGNLGATSFDDLIFGFHREPNPSTVCWLCRMVSAR